MNIRALEEPTPNPIKSLQRQALALEIFRLGFVEARGASNFEIENKAR